MKGGTDGSFKDDAGTSSNAQGFRRSSRIRSAPRVFVPQQKRRDYKLWSAADKCLLLRFLNRLNNREISHAGHNNRFPYRVIKKHIKSKSMKDIRMILSKLERRGAAAALLRMKQQSPVESWCQMADDLTVLTGDDSSRHLIRVCRVMALESIDEDNSEKMSRVTQKKFQESVARPGSVSAATSADNSTAPSSIASASERTPQPSSTRPQDRGADPDTMEMPSEQTMGSAKQKPERRATKRKGKSQDGGVLRGPDYESIYKYIGGLMQGQQNQLGGLESLVILDCLKSIEVQLKERNNCEQKQFVQQRFVDLLQNMYMSVHNDPKYGGGESAVKGPVNITTADLIGSGCSQSRASSDKPGPSGRGPLAPSGRAAAVDANSAAAVNQSEGPVTSEGQSASDSGQPSQSHESSSQSSVQQTLSSETANPKADSGQFKAIGLGSLNPFNVPVKLLEIRKDR